MMIYIAGPMRNLPLYNFPAFDEAAKRFRDAGWQVVNPADLDRAVGVTEHTDPLPKNFMRQALQRDLSAICDSCDAIALLPGWQKSDGVRVELSLAEALGLDVYDAQTMRPLQGESILAEADRLVNGQRNADYGEPWVDHERTAKIWTVLLGKKLAPAEQLTSENVCLMMIGLKMSRLCNAVKRDSIVDIAGYADNLAKCHAHQHRKQHA